MMRKCTPGAGSLVSVFRTDHPGVLPLVEIALKTEGIDYVVRHAGKADSMDWTRSQTPTNRPVVLEVLVAPDEAARAREMVVDLESPAPDLPAAAPDAALGGTIHLEDASTGADLATLTEAQLQELTSHLDEDGPQRYVIDANTVEFLESRQAEGALLRILDGARAGRDHVVIRWSVR